MGCGNSNPKAQDKSKNYGTTTGGAAAPVATGGTTATAGKGATTTATDSSKKKPELRVGAPPTVINTATNKVVPYSTIGGAPTPTTPIVDTTDKFKFTDFNLDNAYIDHVMNRSTEKSPKTPGTPTKSTPDGEVQSPLNVSKSFERNIRDGVEFCFMDFQMMLTEDHVDAGAMKRANYDMMQMSSADLYRHMIRKTPIKDYTFEVIGGHKTRIKLARISSDDKFLISCCVEDKSLFCTDIGLNARVLSFLGHDDVIMDAWISSDQKTLITAGRDNQVVSWDALTAKKQNAIETEHLVLFLRLSPDTKTIMVGIQDNRVLLYDAKLGTERLAYSKHTAIPSCGNFSTDGALIVTGAINGEVMVWYSATGLDRVAIQGMSGAVLNASMSSDNTAILTHDDRMIIMWDIRSGFPLMNIPVEGSPVLRTPKDLMKPDSPKNRDKNAVRYLAAVFIAGNNIMISKTNRRVSVLDPNTGEEELMLATRAHVHCIHSGNKIVAMGDVNGNLYLLHLKL